MITTENFELIEKNEHFIVINKFHDVNFHDEGEINSGLFNQVKQQLALDDLFPVHRLDKMTSGLIIFARNKETAASFQTIFSEHTIEKYYLAISDQKPKKKQGLIKGDMEKSRRGAWKLLRTCKNPAISQFFSFGIGRGLRLYLIKPHSGKTHQIRVALSSIGAQILGDPLYGKSLADRGYLHAYALRFTLNNINYQYIQQPNSGMEFKKLLGNNTENLAQVSSPWDLAWPKI